MRKAMRATIGAGLVFWTAYWLISGGAYLFEHSLVMQQGLGGDGLQMWEVFDVKMVAAHPALRWAAGVVPALLLLRALRPRADRAAEHGLAAAAAGGD
jgi:hypothetical protein